MPQEMNKKDRQEKQISLIKKIISLDKPEGVSHVVVDVSPYYEDNEFKVSLNFIIPDDSDIDQEGFGKLIPSIEKNVEDVLGVRIYVLSFGSTIESFYNSNRHIFDSKLRTESKKEILINKNTMKSLLVEMENEYRQERLSNMIKTIVKLHKPKQVEKILVSVEPKIWKDYSFYDVSITYICPILKPLFDQFTDVNLAYDIVNDTKKEWNLTIERAIESFLKINIFIENSEIKISED